MNVNDFPFKFGNLSSKKIDPNFLTEKFDCIEYGDSDTFYVTKETYKHKEKGWYFNYKFVIRIEDLGAYGCADEFDISINLLPISKHILKKLEDSGNDYENEENPLESNWYITDAMSEGYSITFVRETLPYIEDADWEKMEPIVTEKAQIAACFIDMLNSMRGFYLDQYVNRIGTTGWDYINEWAMGRKDAITATLKRMGAKK